WVFDLKRQVKEIVSSPKGEDETPAWSPDGQRVAWATGADNERVIIERRADGSADPKELWHGQSHVHVLQYTPDGRSILFETESERQVGALKIIQNWLTEVEKRAPAH